MSYLNFAGDVIPPSWKSTITYKTKSGKEQGYAIAWLLLAEVCYWYRPQIVRCERTGRVLETKKRFQGDKLQKSYSELAKTNGLSKNQIKDALTFLRDVKLLDLEFKTVHLQNGKDIYNVLFIEPCAEAVALCNRGIKYFEAVREAFRTYTVKILRPPCEYFNGGSINILTGGVLKYQYTNTEITSTENTTTEREDATAKWPSALFALLEDFDCWDQFAHFTPPSTNWIAKTSKKLRAEFSEIAPKVIKAILEYDKETGGNYLKKRKLFSAVFNQFASSFTLTAPPFAVKVWEDTSKKIFDVVIPIKPSSADSRNLAKIVKRLEEHWIKNVGSSPAEDDLKRGLSQLLSNLPKGYYKEPAQFHAGFIFGNIERLIANLKSKASGGQTRSRIRNKFSKSKFDDLL